MMPTSWASEGAPPTGDPSSGLREFAKTMRRRWKIIYAVSLLSGFIAFVSHSRYEPRYVSKAALALQKSERRSFFDMVSEGGTPTMVDNTEEKGRVYYRYLRSDAYYLVLADALSRLPNFAELELELNTKVANDSDRKAVVNELSKILPRLVSPAYDGVETITLTAESREANTSLVLANTAVDAFLKSVSDSERAELNELGDFLDTQLRETTEKVKASEQALVDYKRAHNIISLEAESRAFSEKLNRIDTEVESLRLQTEQNEKMKAFYEARLRAYAKEIVKNDQRLSSEEYSRGVFERIEALRKQKELLLADGNTEEHWRLQEINAEVTKLARSLRLGQDAEGRVTKTGTAEEASPLDPQALRERLKELALSSEQIRGRLGSLTRAKEVFLRDLNKLPKNEQEVSQFERQAKLQFELLTALQKRQQDLEIRRLSVREHVSLLQAPALPGPNPHPKLAAVLLFGFVVGAFFGAVICLMLEYIDPTVRSRMDLEAAGMTVISEIPYIAAKEHGPSSLVLLTRPESTASMAFRHLRERIRRLRSTADGDKEGTVVTVMSSTMGEGKTLISANLAVAFAKAGKRTLLIDGDLRDPGQNRFFPRPLGMDDGFGLSSVIGVKSLLDEAVFEHPSGLHLLAAGPAVANPSEVFSGERFKVLLRFLRREYDVILIDGPPAEHLVDAVVLSSLSDEILLLANCRVSRRATLAHVYERLFRAANRAPLLLLNLSEDLLNDQHPTFIRQRIGTGEELEIGFLGSDPRDFENSLQRSRSVS